MADWIAMHVNAWRAIGSVPKAIGWDALRSGVTAICRYELAVNRTYQELPRLRHAYPTDVVGRLKATVERAACPHLRSPAGPHVRS